jgi:hypothetical protein
MRVILPLLIPGLCLTFLVTSSCGPSGGDPRERGTAFDSVKLTPYSGSTAVGITYEVRDYDSWLKAYKAHSDPDSRIGIFSGAEDPNIITVLELTRSHEEARASFTSSEFRETLEAEGVISEPVIGYFDIKLRVATPSDKRFRLGVSYEIENYEQWKKIFDEDEPIREKSNLELRAISINAENPSSVYLLFATDDIVRAKEVFNSDELRKRMTEAGVLTQPVFAVLNAPEEGPR